MSKYRLTITRTDNMPVMLRPGSQAERDLVEEVLSRVQGVGVLTTEATVREKIRGAIEETIRAFKHDVIPS